MLAKFLTCHDLNSQLTLRLKRDRPTLMTSMSMTLVSLTCRCSSNFFLSCLYAVSWRKKSNLLHESHNLKFAIWPQSFSPPILAVDRTWTWRGSACARPCTGRGLAGGPLPDPGTEGASPAREDKLDLLLSSRLRHSDSDSWLTSLVILMALLAALEAEAIFEGTRLEGGQNREVEEPSRDVL